MILFRSELEEVAVAAAREAPAEQSGKRHRLGLGRLIIGFILLHCGFLLRRVHPVREEGQGTRLEFSDAQPIAMLRSALMPGVADFNHTFTRCAEGVCHDRVGPGGIVVGGKFTSLRIEQTEARVERRSQALCDDLEGDALAFANSESVKIRGEFIAAAIDGDGWLQRLRGGSGVVRAAALDGRERINHYESKTGNSVGRDEPDGPDADGCLPGNNQSRAGAVSIGDFRTGLETCPHLPGTLQRFAEELNGGGFTRPEACRQGVVEHGRRCRHGAR